MSDKGTSIFNIRTHGDNVTVSIRRDMPNTEMGALLARIMLQEQDGDGKEMTMTHVMFYTIMIYLCSIPYDDAVDYLRALSNGIEDTKNKNKE